MQHVETCVASATEEFYSHPYEESDDGSNVQLSYDIDKILHSNAEPSTSQEKPAGQTDDFQNFVMEFSTSEKTGPPINDDLAKIVNTLLSDKLSKLKIDELTEKYSRPENCEYLVAPKTNKAVWNQLRENSKKADMGLQKCQQFFMGSVYAILQACNSSSGPTREILVHALVLSLSGNRELNLRRREFMKPDLNTQFTSLCSASTPVTKELFGDDVSKEIDELSKANQLGEKLAAPKRGRGSRQHPYGAYQNRGSAFRGRGRGGFPRAQRAFLGNRNFNNKRGVNSASNTKTSQD